MKTSFEPPRDGTAWRMGIGHFTRQPCAIGALLVVFALTCLAEAAWSQGSPDIEEIFNLFDQNGDGVIDRAEFDVNKIYVISAFDTNGNDEIDRDETNISEENFRLADSDGNGAISGLEFLDAPFGKFEALDADGDQRVTREEFESYIESLRR